MSVLLALVRSQTIFEMDSGFGVPLGVIFLVVLAYKFMQPVDASRTRTRSPRFWRSNTPSKPVDWEKHWAEQAKIKKAKDAAWERKWAEWRTQQPPTRD